MLTATPGGVILAVRLIPRARRTGASGLRGDALLVRVQAPPVEGAANEELVAFLARTFNVPRQSIGIQTGAHARLKRVAISGVTVEAARAILDTLGRDVRTP